MTAAEIDNLDEILSLLGKTAEECIDLDLLLEIGEKAEPLTAVKDRKFQRKSGRKSRLRGIRHFVFIIKKIWRFWSSLERNFAILVR